MASAIDQPEDALKGTSLEVYRFLLRNGRSTGVREVQRALNLSTPSLAAYHLAKLEEAGLLKKENGNYTINKVVLEDCIKVSRFLIPRYLCYAIFAVLLLVIELTIFRPPVITSFYFLATSGTFVCMLAFCYETAKVWSKGGF
jgi:DNA-binding transcriptional ArsR family regulator